MDLTIEEKIAILEKKRFELSESVRHYVEEHYAAEVALEEHRLPIIEELLWDRKTSLANVLSELDRLTKRQTNGE